MAILFGRIFSDDFLNSSIEFKSSGNFILYYKNDINGRKVSSGAFETNFLWLLLNRVN